MQDLKLLEKILSAYPKYRLAQVKQTIFRDLKENWLEVSNLPADLKNILDKEFSLKIKAKDFLSQDKKTIKILLTLADDLQIESVLMTYAKRNTVCISTQVGCPLACAFCATGQLGFKRNLSASEIIEQVLFFSRLLKDKDERVNNLVFMGMGEPFLNYDAVLEAIRIMNRVDTFNIGIRHFSISTAGLPEKIRQLADEDLAINLAISLHAPNDLIRKKIMPIAEKYSLKEIFSSVDYFIKKTSRKVMFEYLLIKDVNDSSENALELASLMRKKLYHLNLMTYNLTGAFSATHPETVRRFKEILEKNKVQVTFRRSFGEDISGACGQLAGKEK
ncbi:MAG TPA: 23S rRNA (adenine(2503)-C(2))-methyltransferase RlmN [bacterium]|nr:23S rRNA (adenine(2503)-C(2))-methyltransferase RlmN [bacterium]